MTVDGRRVRALARRLERHFGELAPPRASDPLDELILTVQSQHTSDLNAERAFGLLRARYPTWDDVVRAPTGELADTIRSGGLANTKAARIQAILRRDPSARGRGTTFRPSRRDRTPRSPSTSRRSPASAPRRLRS